MSDGSTIFALLQALTAKVDNLANDVAVLTDRRSDSEDQSKAIDELEKRIEVLERDHVERGARTKLLAGIAAIGSSAGGAAIIKILGLLGG